MQSRGLHGGWTSPAQQNRRWMKREVDIRNYRASHRAAVPSRVRTGICIGLADARWRQEQTSGRGYPESRGQHHRYHRTQVAGHGRLGTGRHRQIDGPDS